MRWLRRWFRDRSHAVASAPVATVEPLAPRLEPSIPPDEEVTLLYGAAPRPVSATSDQPPVLDEEIVPLASDSRVKIAYEQEAEEEETTSPLARILISAKGDSDRGQKRRANEDSLLSVLEHSLFAVADGMGGYHGGAVASSLAVETLRQSFERERFVGELRADKPVPRRAHELASAVLQANWAVFHAARRDPSLAQMGSTLVAARFSPNKQRVYIANVGDSRCYRLRRGKLRQLTTDQTMRLVGLHGPGANDLLQAIGVTADLAIDLIVDKPQPNDIYLLCSDGLTKMVEDSEIERLLVDESDLEAAVYGLIERANDHGGKDNVTVVLIKVIERAVRAAYAGWSKLPDAVREPRASANIPSTEDATVIGSLPLDERTTLTTAPRVTVAAKPRKMRP
jgi:serine/threonine protein phosphatase PrpC